MIIRRGVLILVAVLLAGCVHDNPLYQSARERSIESLDTGVGGRPRPQHSLWMAGLVIDFPDPDGWQVLYWKPDRFIARQTLGGPLHTSALIAAKLPVPPGAPFPSEDAFMGFARQDRESDHSWEERRIAFDAQPAGGEYRTCLRYYRKFETRDPKNAPDRLLLYEERGYLCRHPVNRNIYLRVDYSERYPADGPSDSFDDRAAKALVQVHFSQPY